MKLGVIPVVNKRPTPKGNAGYDGGRENIDPHVKTKVLSAKEIAGSPVFVNGGLTFGELYAFGNTSSVSVPSGTNVQVTGLTAGQSNNTTVDAVESHIIILNAGIYKINFSASFSGTGNVTWNGGVYLNNGTTRVDNCQIERKLGVGGDVGVIADSGLVSLSVGDTVELWMEHDSGSSANVVVKNVGLDILQVGG